MKKSIVLGFAVSAFFLAGCCTAPHASQWEYKVAAPSVHLGSPQAVRDNQQTLLNDLGKDGWVLISEDNGTFYLKRRIK